MIDGNLTGTTIPGQNGHGNNAMKGYSTLTRSPEL